MDYSAFEQTMLEPVLRWMYRAVLAEQGIDMEQVLPNVDDFVKDITGLASDGDNINTPRVSAHINKVYYQFETLAIHCKAGVNRTALMSAVALLAFYEETGLTVDNVMEYIMLLRPVCEFTKYKLYQCPEELSGLL